MGDDSSYLAGESASNFTHVEASWTQGLGELGAHSRALAASAVNFDLFMVLPRPAQQ
jgi:hypothetical protein